MVEQTATAERLNSKPPPTSARHSRSLGAHEAPVSNAKEIAGGRGSSQRGSKALTCVPESLKTPRVGGETSQVGAVGPK